MLDTPLAASIADPGATVAVAAAALAYYAGRVRWRRHTGTGGGTLAALSFGCGLGAVMIALASPLDGRADTSLTAHMIQHVLLLCVAGPLIALGRPTPTLIWALPERGRDRALGVYRRLLRSHSRRYPQWVAIALLTDAAIMWAWHLPDLYQAALANPALHAVEHATFLGAATAAWWSVANGPRAQRGAAAIAALIGSVPGIGLGSALVLAPNPWYPIYVTGTRGGALGDQQVAGVVMWAFGGMAAVIAGAALFASWLQSGPAEPTQPVPPIRYPSAPPALPAPSR